MAEYGALQTYFQTLHGSTQFPVAQKGFDDVESSFGPRFQISTNNYDFHRGIDVDGVEGDDILAVTSGVFWEYREFQAGGHIGEMSNSGSSGGAAYADHLHMEVRVGTTNSLIFQDFF